MYVWLSRQDGVYSVTYEIITVGFWYLERDTATGMKGLDPGRNK